jgi:ferredoxin
LASSAKPRPEKSYRHWITARKVTQYVSFLIFLVLFVLARQRNAPAGISNLAMRVDPLVMLAHLFVSRVYLLGATIALLTIILSILFGRAWCGWICPLGTILDLVSPRSPGQARNISDSWRKFKYGLLMVILAAALFGNLSLLLFDPLTLLYRTLTTSLWPALDQLVTALEATLYRTPALAAPIATLDQWLRPVLLPSEPMYYRQATLMAVVFLGVIALNWITPRFWCRYLCPLGGLLGLVSKFSLFRRQVSDDCKGCGLCSPVCPTGTIDPDQGYASDPGECTMCLDCLEACPRSSINFTPAFSTAQWNHYDPGRRTALLSIGGALLGITLLKSDWLNQREHTFLIQPPGARENDLISKCIRCGECARACPTTAIQLSIAEAGIDGFWTPVLVPRIGYCDYSCNACGTICPVQAIPPMTLEAKRQQVIGKAYIDRDRCIAWADHDDCIVCEEMCPLPEKAIHLEEQSFPLFDGESALVQVPHVEVERCIGCGICEYKCPVAGQAAIRVYVPVADPQFYAV